MQRNWKGRLVRQKSGVVAIVPCCRRQHAAAAVECHNHCQLSTSPRHLSSSCTRPVTRIGTLCHASYVRNCQVTSHAALEVKSLATLDAPYPTCCQATGRRREMDCVHRADCRADSCHDHSDVTSALHSCNISQTHAQQLCIKQNVTKHTSCPCYVYVCKLIRQKCMTLFVLM